MLWVLKEVAKLEKERNEWDEKINMLKQQRDKIQEGWNDKVWNDSLTESIESK